MSVPGSNLLNQAFRAIARQTISYYAYTGRTTNAAGNQVSQYAAPVDIRGSLQAVPTNRYMNLGLDFAKSYVNFFCPQELLGLQRDVSGDRFVYAGKTYKIESLTPWFAQDGWVQALAVLVDEAIPQGAV